MENRRYPSWRSEVAACQLLDTNGALTCALLVFWPFTHSTCHLLSFLCRHEPGSRFLRHVKQNQSLDCHLGRSQESHGAGSTFWVEYASYATFWVLSYFSLRMWLAPPDSSPGARQEGHAKGCPPETCPLSRCPRSGKGSRAWYRVAQLRGGLSYLLTTTRRTRSRASPRLAMMPIV